MWRTTRKMQSSTAAPTNRRPAPYKGASPRSESRTATKLVPPMKTMAVNAARIFESGR